MLDTALGRIWCGCSDSGATPVLSWIGEMMQMLINCGEVNGSNSKKFSSVIIKKLKLYKI